MLQVVGETLRDCVSCAPCEWVRARALDALYDVFGADECPAQLFSSLQIMPILENAAYQFTARVSNVHSYLYMCIVRTCTVMCAPIPLMYKSSLSLHA